MTNSSIGASGWSRLVLSSQCGWALLACLILGAAPWVGAQTKAETKAFGAAADQFRLLRYERAETNFAQFTQTYTNSPLLPEAILYQAEARLERSNYAGAIELLSAHQHEAGKWTDQYLFWQAEAYLRKGDWSVAASSFARLATEFPGSSLCLEAAISEATARARLSQWAQVAQLLGQTNGIFQSASPTNSSSKRVPSGYLLLAEARLTLGEYPGAEAALQPVAQLPLISPSDWQRQYLICRVKQAEGQLTEALSGATNLLALATNSAQPSLQAESIAFEGGLLERLGRTDEAIAAYTNNLAEGVPIERRGQALLRVTDLLLKQNRTVDAAQMLQEFVNKNPTAPMADRALLNLGELWLHQQAAALDPNHLDHASARTNALGPLRALITQYPQSPLQGKAELDLGWCFWLETNLPECQVAFQSAIERLPVSADLATAYFKLGDSEFAQTNFTGALTNYSAIIAMYESKPVLAAADRDLLETNLLERALYQAVRAALAARDLPRATSTLSKLLAWYPGGFHSERAVLLTGLAISREGNPEAAREIFLAFETEAPNASLLPEVELAIARTYEQETNWDEAIAQYDDWLAGYASHPARPRAEYYRAWANFQAGRESAALGQFTNLVARFPTNEFALLAQLWVADYYFRSGNPMEAERNYELLFRNTNLPPSELACEGRMMAGRAAVAQQHWNDATNYFADLANLANCPTDLKARAMSALGDTYMSMGNSAGTNKAANYADAISEFDGICRLYPSNQVAVLAMGQKANCLLQYAQTPLQYEQASNAFQVLIDSPRTDVTVTVRSQALVGLGAVLEKQAEQVEMANSAAQTNLLEQALNCYLDVFTRNLPQDDPPEPAYWFWVERAGLDAARLLTERFQDWKSAVAVYNRLEELLPPMRDSLEQRKKKAQQRLDAAQKTTASR